MGEESFHFHSFSLLAIELCFLFVFSALFSHAIQLLDNGRFQVNGTFIFRGQQAELGFCLERQSNRVELIHRSCMFTIFTESPKQDGLCERRFRIIKAIQKAPSNKNKSLTRNLIATIERIQQIIKHCKAGHKG